MSASANGGKITDAGTGGQAVRGTLVSPHRVPGCHAPCLLRKGGMLSRREAGEQGASIRGQGSAFNLRSRHGDPAAAVTPCHPLGRDWVTLFRTIPSTHNRKSKQLLSGQDANPWLIIVSRHVIRNQRRLIEVRINKSSAARLHAHSQQHTDRITRIPRGDIPNSP